MQLNILKRKRIDALLDQWSSYPLTIVEAPMGYGKTTAVRQYFENQGIKPVWLSFHPQSDFSSDWEKLSLEIKKQDQQAGAALLSLGFPADVPQTEQVLSVLSRFASDRQQVIVLDDFHLVNSRRLNQLIEDLVIEQIENLYLILITRNTIGFNAAMLVAKGLCRTIDQQALKFSEDEVQDYCELMVKGLATEDLKKICVYGEGWISLTYMLLLGLERGIPVGLNLSLEALIDQTLFQNYDKKIQEFLIELSIMTDFSEKQATFVTEFADSGAMLRQLQQENSFIRYDERERCYTIHAVLLDFLRNRQHFSVAQRKIRYRRLGEWFLTAQDFQEAYRLFYLAGEPLLIFEHMNQPEHITPLMGKFEGFWPLFKETEAAVLFAYPITGLQFILVGLLHGTDDFSALALRRLNQMEVHYQNCPDIASHLRNRVLAEIMILRKLTVFNHAEQATKLNDQILALLDGRQSYIIRRENEYTFGSPNLLYMYFRDPGRFRETANLMIEKFPIYAQYTDGCGTGTDYLVRAEYSLEIGAWEEAAINAEKAIYKAATKDQHGIIICANFVLLRLMLKDGRKSEALEGFYRLEGTIKALNNPRYNTTLALCKGYLFAVLGRPERIPFWLQVGDMKVSELFNQGVAFNYVVYGKAVTAARDFVRLEVLAETFVAFFSFFHNQLGFIHNDLFKAIARYQLSGLEAGVSALKIALDSARSDGIILPFIENAEALLPMLEEVLRQTPDDVFAGRILCESNTFMTNQKKEKLPDIVLTQREKEVLQLMAQGLKRDTIARRLFVSSVTVKTHLQNIYKKLDVKGKNAAINTALQNGLLDRE